MPVDPTQTTNPYAVVVGQVWRPRRKSEQARTITEINDRLELIFYVKENGWPHFATPLQFQRWAVRVGALPDKEARHPPQAPRTPAPAATIQRIEPRLRRDGFPREACGK